MPKLTFKIMDMISDQIISILLNNKLLLYNVKRKIKIIATGGPGPNALEAGRMGPVPNRIDHEPLGFFQWPIWNGPSSAGFTPGPAPWN